MRKNFISILSIFILLTLILAGCGEKSDNNGAIDNSAGETITTNSGDNENLINNEEVKTEQEQPTIAAKNVVSPDFALSDGFIEPIDQLTTVPDGYIGIYTAEDFDKIRLNTRGKYILMNDIDLSALDEWKAISFPGGILDGNGYVVKSASSAIFDIVTNSTITNLGVYANITYEYRPSSSNIKAGGMVNELRDSEITNCYFEGEISYSGGNGIMIAGIAGKASSSFISSCYNLAEITVDNASTLYVGGISGDIYECSIMNCFNKGNINSMGKIGGIVGTIYKENSVIKECFNEGNLNGGTVGGIVGYADTQADISSCYNSGDILAGGNKSRGAGILADYFWSDYTIVITNCYNTGTIEGDIALGITRYSADVKYCYNMGELQGETVGAIAYSSSKIEYCYFLDNVENATPDGALFAYVSSLTESEMKQASSFEGFDFENMWAMGNSDYPYPVFKPQS